MNTINYLFHYLIASAHVRFEENYWRQVFIMTFGWGCWRGLMINEGIVHTGNNTCNYPYVLVQSYFPINR